MLPVAIVCAAEFRRLSHKRYYAMFSMADTSHTRGCRDASLLITLML